MRLANIDELRKDIVERGTQLSGCYSAGIARYMDRMLAHVLDAVDNAPTVDAVPVVRCNDCKWFGKMGCAIEVVDETDMPKENDFCSFAERKR